MRAIQVQDDLTLRDSDIDTPQPGQGEVLVRVYAAGVCGTDLHILDGMIKPDTYPMTLGHEAAGVAEQVGPGVALATGTRVAVFNKLFCGACEQCLLGRQNLCAVEPGQLGFNRDGGDAEYVLAPERNLAALPDAVDFATAAVLTCAGMTAVHATRMSRLESGQTAVVNGIGGVGILVVQVAARAGATVIAVADSPDKAELAAKHGAADVVVLGRGDDYAALPDAVRSAAGGRGADVFFELVGTTDTMTAGIRSLAPRGRFVSTGYTDQPLNIHPIEFILSESSLVSTVAATRTDLNDAIAMAAAGNLTVPLAGSYPLDGIADALAALRSRSVLGRQVLVPS
jgi:D-arabinose 1-dehydrogenase-like Zn-dependent alcohol dehydrogenase